MEFPVPDEMFALQTKEKKNQQNPSSPIRPTNPSINQYFITGEFVISESPGEPCSRGSAFVQIYSATICGQGTNEGKLSGRTKLKGGKSRMENDKKIRKYRIKVYIEHNFGNPGAFIIKNNHKHRFFLESATLHAPGKSDIYFDCRSWVYPFKLTNTQRRFFSNTSYLPRDTPEGLKELREDELINLRGNKTGERKYWERIYDYDCYNDLGNPHKGREHRRPVLGGSTEHPYPSRGRTGRLPCNADPSSESLPETTSFEIYVPPDERLSLKKQSELISNIIQVTLHFIIPEKDFSCNFQSYEQIREMFSSSTHEELEENRKKQEAERRGNKRPDERSSNKIQVVEKWFMEKWMKISPYELVTKFNRKIEKRRKRKEMEKKAKGILEKVVPKKYVKEITRECKKDRKKFLTPHIIAEDEWAWKDDDEFGRQMLAGINPTRIQGLTTSSPLEQKEILRKAKDSLLECIQECFRYHEPEGLLRFMEAIGFIPCYPIQEDFRCHVKGLHRSMKEAWERLIQDDHTSEELEGSQRERLQRYIEEAWQMQQKLIDEIKVKLRTFMEKTWDLIIHEDLKKPGTMQEVLKQEWKRRIKNNCISEELNKLYESTGEELNNVIKEEESRNSKESERLQRSMKKACKPPIGEEQKLKGLQMFMEKEWDKLIQELIYEKRDTLKRFLESAWDRLIQEDLIYEDNRLFILDHHDYLTPFLSRINTTGVCAYASRTLLFRRGDDTLKPIAIELSWPDSSSEKNNSKSCSENENKYKSAVYVPPVKDGQTDKTKEAQWQLAKAHVAANDSVYHQLISHWLHTHAVVEPFIIATRRQLSVMHPIHQLLDPHFKDTMHVNALARSILINSGGILEKTLFSGKISMELSSALYKQWKFVEQALPVDLVKRNMAKEVKGKEKQEYEKHLQDEKESQEHPKHADGFKLFFKYYGEDEDRKQPARVYKLLFEDYPYGAGGLEIWTAVHEWVENFCKSFYKVEGSFKSEDESVKDDKELRAWWLEVRNQGHVDQKSGWYELETLPNLIEALTTLIWIASGLHASVNFGQYAYAAYPPNRPTLCRKLIPKEEEKEFDELLRDPDKYFLSMLPTRSEMALGVALTHVLSRHTSDEVYLGQRPSNWTDNETILKIFEKFREKLQKIEKNIKERNRDSRHNNRWGPAKIPYKLLYPDTSNEGSTGGITGKGIPNSISI